ncbi:MAG: hypothetical protein K2Q01_05930, partial [Rickettsiales bacterium]|nr:hypothetical protein [Rickettsiales bacterium]
GLRAKKKLLDSLIDPARRPEEGPPLTALTDAQLTAMTNTLAGVIRPVALNANFLDGIQIDEYLDEAKYAEKHAELADKLLKAMENDPTNPLTRNGMEAVADEVAAEYINGQLGISTPDNVVERLRLSKEAAALHIIELNIGPALEQKQGLLNSMIDPRNTEGLTETYPEMRNDMAAKLSNALLPMALDDSLASGVVREDKSINTVVYLRKHEDIADKLYKAIKDEGYPLTERGLRALANEAAAEFLNKQAGGISTPLEVQRNVIEKAKALAAVEIIELNVGPALDKKKKLLDSLIDPRKANAPKALTPQMRKDMTNRISDVLMPVALDNSLVQGLVTDGNLNEELYAERHGKLAKKLAEALKKSPTNQLTDNGVDALAYEVAAEFMNKQAGITPAPAKVAALLKESKEKAALEII